MNSIKSNFNYATDPALVVITIIAIILVLFILTKIIEKYRSTYTIYEKTDSINNNVIKQFHNNNEKNLNLIEKKLTQIRENKTTIHFTECIQIQESSLHIIESILDYSYLGESTKNSLQALHNEFTLNFHNIAVENLQMIQIDLQMLEEDLSITKDFITTHRIFNKFTLPLEIFLSDFNHFMKFCSQHSKNAVLSKMTHFNSLSKFELESFEKSFSQFAHKNPRVESSEFYQLYLLVVELFKEENCTVLNSIKRLQDLQYKIDDLQKKTLVLENKIELLTELLFKLHQELFSLDEKTRTTSSLRLLNPLLFNIK